MVVSLLFIPLLAPRPPPQCLSSAAADPAVSHEEHVQDMPTGQRVSLVWRPEALGCVNVSERNMFRQLALVMSRRRVGGVAENSRNGK